ncbi:hypothetical protein B0A52_04449 [Exophiala mesophila]|uniref:Major facilitator superfamily (MFS) profile domain-containing protein n=1 Tax=Exophiala mesophila TaxID=212818 RepID=A0A438N917_EXOME|nr:hypothetical protein B0A52_04449 [Exophiala mesophila]
MTTTNSQEDAHGLSLTASHHRQHHHQHDDESRLLRRTGSQDFSAAESIAVREVISDDSSSESEYDEPDVIAPKWPRSTKYLLLLCALFTSLAFGVTQVPLLYVFRLMTCDAYYQDHPSQRDDSIVHPPTTLTSYFVHLSAPAIPGPSSSDRCSVHAIEASTALSISILGATTTVFGLFNLFWTGYLIKRIGVKATLFIQVSFPAVRLFIQNVGVEVWGHAGINIVQSSQIVSIIGGPSGYLLVLNTFMTDIIEHEGRTAALGRVTGAAMAGSAFGFLAGGLVAEAYGVKIPFRLAFLLFAGAGFYVLTFLPYIPPAENKHLPPQSGNEEKKTRLLTRYFGPLTVFMPKKFIGRDGLVRTEYGAFLLACGVFLGILATGYLVTLLQLYATDVFDFGTKQNGWLIFIFSMLRGLFLTFVFPKLIALGRRLTSTQDANASKPSEQQPLLPTPPSDPQVKSEQTFAFDLTYTKASLLADGFLTLLCSFVHRGWQMYLVAAILPFASGTGSASKGTILQMLGGSATSSERTDALAGISLVENMARLSTTSVFGAVFAGFTSIGKPNLVFTCNAAVAFVGFVILLFARFPLEGSRPVAKDDGTENE